MIERIEIAGCTPFSDATEVMDRLRPVNFIYGPNGAGKTTLSRLIANADAGRFTKCSLSWRDNHGLQTLVYNRDFVRDNFNQNSKLKGIFTLGKQNIAVQNQIAAAKLESDDFLKQIGQLKSTLDGMDGRGGKRGELSVVEDAFRDECWKLKVKHEARLKEALRGHLDSKNAFKERLLKECQKAPTTPLPTQSALEEKAASLHGQTPTSEAVIAELHDAAFLKWEADPILSRRIIGKADVDIAAIIQKLGNSDWVRQGVTFLGGSEGVCPFCQQDVPDQLAVSLAEYFDETFLKETALLNAVEQGYKLEGERLQQALGRLTASSPRFVDLDKVRTESRVFGDRFAVNTQRIAEKVKEPSQIVSLEPLGDVLMALRELVVAANEKIKCHNEMVANLASERSQLAGAVWAFFAHSEIAQAYKTYCAKKSALQKAIDSLSDQISKAEDERKSRERTIQQLEKTVTSIQPTVNEINRLLSGFGFRSFHLRAMNGNFYRLCRPDGSDAQETLSEGESSFITFLYFFHLLKGSLSEAGLNTDRVVVFDDPVSSLDSDVLFIVSSLIKQAIEEACKQTGRIKQVFVLTHNVYFFKEVVLDGCRSANARQKHETFWTIRKVNDVSSVRSHDSNPIKTSYDLLWEPLRQRNLADQCLQNNMRRILEHYFRILGGVSNDAIVDHFEGEEKLICRSLVSWVHDGSHSIPDDIFHALDESAMERYIAVFQRVFTKTGHANHYNMMMGLPYVISAEV